jgi:D-arginine dehydrogenase
MRPLSVVVVGAGIAGVSIAYELARACAVNVLERESLAPLHSTARSAALGSATYGPFVIRELTIPSLSFLKDPPRDFSERPLCSPRGVLHVARRDQLGLLREMHHEGRRSSAPVELLDAGGARLLAPVLSPAYVAGALYEPEACDLHVAEIYEAYRRGLKARGGHLVRDAEVVGFERHGGGWSVHTPRGRYRAAVVVNAAGAWADQVARMAGAGSCGLVPKRRTVAVVATEGHAPDAKMPFTFGIAEDWYFRAETTGVLLSPADETPMAPCDVQPDELDVAIAVDRFHRATSLRVTRLLRKWAGLRTFAPDGLPVVGFDPVLEGLFWLAGQGGFGIETAPTLARVAASQLQGQPLPHDLLGLEPLLPSLAPARLEVTQKIAAE